MSTSSSLSVFKWEVWKYESIPWDYIDEQWWSLPIEFLAIIYCFIGFHVVSDSHLLPSLDAFCRKWNISHQTAQPTIYALGAVAPIIILSNVAFMSDILKQTTNAHRLGICSIIGFGLATTSLIPSFSVFSLIGRIALPKKTTIRDHIFIIILLSMFLIIIITGQVLWWKSCIIGTVYIIYLFSIICYPKIKQFCEPPNPLETNRLLNKLRESKSSPFNRGELEESILEQSYQKIEYEEQPEESSPFDSRVLLSNNINKHELNTVNDMMNNEESYNYNSHRLPSTSNYSNCSMSPDRKSMQSNRSSITSLRHPMLMSEYDPDFPLDDNFPSDIEEYENESLSITEIKTPTKNDRNDNEEINKIVLMTPKYQSSVYHIFPTIKFESLNQHNLNPQLPSNTNSIVTKNEVTRNSNLKAFFQEIFQIFTAVYRIMSFPIKILLQFTIPSCKPHDKCECLYPLSFLLSIIWIIVFAFILIIIIYHWSEYFSFSLSIIGIIYIGPIATYSNIVDCVTLSLQGFASEMIINSYHIQISNLFFGIIIPLIASSLLNAINPFHHYVKQGIAVYLEVLIAQSIILFLPLLCISNNIELSRHKGFVYIFVYIISMIAFYYFSCLKAEMDL